MSLDAWFFDDGSDPNRRNVPLGGMTFREMARGSGTGSLGSNPQATRVYYVDWDQHTQFLTDLLGWSEYTGTGFLNRVLPDEHPDYNYFFATDAVVKPVGAADVDGRTSNWTLAEVTATYKPLPYAVKTVGSFTSEIDRYVSRMPKASAQYASANNMGMFIANGNTNEPLQFTPGIIVPEASVIYRWHQIPAVYDPDLDPGAEFRIPGIDSLLGYLGKTNSTTFDYIYGPGTMLLVEIGGEMRMPQLQDGLYYWDIEFGFINKDFGPSTDEPSPARAGVNYIYDFKNGKYRLVTSTGSLDGNRIYGSADLNQLFIPAE